MNLPVIYHDIPLGERWKVREAYAKLQNGKCHHCGSPLNGGPSKEIQKMHIDLRLFPKGFLNHPVHLHHSHETGLTIGAVHAKCNAVLWQYHGE